MYSFALKTGHYIIILLVFFTIISILYSAFLKHFFAVKRVKRSLQKHNKDFIFYKANKTIDCDFILKIYDKTYYVKVLDVPHNCELQINNIDAFYYYSNFNKAAKINPIANMSKFMKSKMENKIIILSFKAKAIKMYINECEMIKVNEKTNVYNVHILNYNEYNELAKKSS
ncbi:MAG: hypothetical protein MR270_00105 [Erysipelotrichaceae bacterium]|nr:hypothetical protein [Erysipelotrichaceae bacterium]